MNAEVHDLKACEVFLDDAKAELKRLLADSRFRVTERQKDILRYLAERRFEGCEEGVKAYSIALDVLGRPSGFDASTDPIVRIEISRLRSALDAYYQAFGLPTASPFIFRRASTRRSFRRYCCRMSRMRRRWSITPKPPMCGRSIR